MMKTTFKITSAAAHKGNEIAVIKSMRTLGDLRLKDAKLGSDTMVAGDTFTFESSNDPSQIRCLATFGVEIVGRETDTYVAASRDLAIQAISRGNYSTARSVLMALVDIDPFAH